MNELFDIAKLDSWIRDLNLTTQLIFKSELENRSKEELLFKIDKLKEALCKENITWQQK